MKPERIMPIKDRHLLVAVDESDSSKRAVLYVADFLGGVPGFAVTLFSIIPEPEEDFFASDAEREAWIDKQIDKAYRRLDTYRTILIQSGFPWAHISWDQRQVVQVAIAPDNTRQRIASRCSASGA